MTETNFGLTSWDEQVQTSKPQPKQDDRVKLPFIRLKDGNNVLRIITAPAKYWQIKFQDGKSQFGTRVNCAFPAVDRNECPTVQAGYKPKKRYLAGVIDRSEEGGAIKIYDMSVLVYEQLQAFKADPEVGVPSGYDINIRYNRGASSPAGFYSVVPRPPKALSEEDQELINSVGSDVIEENLVRLCTPPSVESVTGFLKKLGWDGESKVTAAAPAKAQLEETSDDDYSFDKPVAATA